MEVTKFSLGFYVDAYVAQTVSIVAEDLTSEQLVAGLNEGKYLTTISTEPDKDHPEIVQIDEEGNEVCVAVILRQVTNDEGSFTNFESLGAIEEE